MGGKIVNSLGVVAVGWLHNNLSPFEVKIMFPNIYQFYWLSRADLPIVLLDYF